MAVDPKAEAASRPFEHRLVIRETRFSMPVGQEDATIQEIYRAIGRDERRNRMLVRDILAVVGQRRCPLVLTERREHVEAIAGLLRGKVGDVIVLRGGAGRKAQREARARLAHASAESGRVVLATGRYAGEGFDDPQLDTLILAMPCSWKGTLIQYAGRIHRQRSGKAEVRIYDYVDRDVPVLRRMSERRLRAYQAIGYVQRPMALACDA